TDYTEANKYKNKGLLTGSITAQMNADGTTGSTYLYSVMYYNNKKQLVQTKGNNHLTGGIEKEYIAYNFTGQPTQRKHIHQATGKNTQTEVYAYTYDHAGRLLTTTHQLTDGTTVKPQVALAENTYDDLGRLKTNKKGGQANLNTIYAYNIRSWTNSITNAHFNQALTYSYNGNISSMQWGQAGKTRKYTFTYDNLSRLKGAVYTGESPTNFAASYTYDKHGNIKTLQRYGMTTASAYGIIDNLTAEHTGNQLKYITDAGPNVTLNASMDFKDYTKGTGIEYTYNANGAMVKDLNKGISAITYNTLNLPQMVDIKNMNAEGRNEYTYSASGQKLKVVQKWNPNYNTAPVIGSGINVSSLTMSATTDYVGNIIYENNTLKRILVDGGYNEGGNYYFYITDHLGNNRIVANAAASVVQSTQYYPFGMPFADAAGVSVQPYKYNNKELDGRNGLNWYDYSARYLALDFPVMPTIDPMAEKYYSISPYAYCNNNPLRFIDPTGMAYGDYYAMNGTYLGTDGMDDDILYAVQNDNYQTDDAGNTVIFDETQITNVTEETGVTHSEFQQLAAFAYNETYDNNTTDKFRVANAIVNRQEEAGGTLQKSIDKLRYNNDSHEARMGNIQNLPGTATKAYAKFMNTTLGGRNNNAAMKNSNAAALNAVSSTGIDYTTSLDGKTATQWRGARTGSGSTSNRFFTGYPVSTSNQITKFKYNNVLK
ncbi:MAG: hypothetical protein LBQ74_15645, partial [Prevotella sp.]|nr:hypothetical protein [Prevotella sp.]